VTQTGGSTWETVTVRPAVDKVCPSLHLFYLLLAGQMAAV
jgi:hypothetical protein